MRIVPYKSVGPIEFGNRKSDCLSSLGPPKSVRLSGEGIEELEYDKLVVRIDPSSMTSLFWFLLLI
jgi:hypothetical protein